MLPPSPSGPFNNKKAKKASAKILRKAVNAPLPQSDDADLIVHEQSSNPSGEESLSTTSGPLAVHETQEASGDLMVLEPEEDRDATAGHEPKVDERETAIPDAPWPFMIHPFQDDSLILYERVAAFDHFERTVKADRKQWEEEKAPCGSCGKRHPPPCATRSHLAAIKGAMAEGRQLRKEWDVQGRRPLGEPQGEMLKREVKMANSHQGLTTPAVAAKTAFCSTCAKYHPGGAKECTVPFCTKGCSLNHPLGEACGAAVKRFANIKRLHGGGDGPSEEKKSVPAPSKAMATGGFDTAKFKAFYDAIGDDPDVAKSSGELFKALATKRPAEEPAAKPSSNKKGKKKQKAGGESSCQVPKPAPKEPEGSDDKGKAKAKKGGVSTLTGTVFSHR
ncbi:hypothetical protein BKA58DRAFT_317803 [Alternaria rosae]|uniref:uncharacterized protein n=1 Tax=Alternaria rosae TaxID=1187941 RepID=UPI001E8ED1C7|nr:uncharacterized protein BKA58DRAFT_317803 [Alternaria rosae]KAH6868715.1 hypothetical protein BKA58DRAFT_317803 [Alternaria rosae]